MPTLQRRKLRPRKVSLSKATQPASRRAGFHIQPTLESTLLSVHFTRRDRRKLVMDYRKIIYSGHADTFIYSSAYIINTYVSAL